MMSGRERMKRRLLREAVRENLDTLHGVRRPPPRRSGVAGWVRSGLLLLASVVFFSSTMFLQGPAPGYAAQRPAAVPQNPPERVSRAVERALANLPAAIDPALFSLAVRRVAIDPGHGGEDR